MQTYCTTSDIEALWPPGEIVASVDDDASGSLSATEQGYIDRAIERAAGLMNARLEMRYRLADLEGNAWCRDANASIAAYLLATRQGATAPAHLQQQCDAYIALLDAIARGHSKVPETFESFDMTPGVTNFGVYAGQVYRKVAPTQEIDP